MYSETVQSIIIFILCIVILLILFSTFIITIILKYQKKQNTYFKDLNSLKSLHENALLQAKLEIQEQTFQNISREIHDNIGQKLSLATIHLNVLCYDNGEQTKNSVANSMEIISEAIKDLSDISKSMSSETLLEKGLIKAIDMEISQLQKSGLYKVELINSGDKTVLEHKKELILFRIVQESLHNIIKHAQATYICISLHFNDCNLMLSIEDNGNGFVHDKKKHGIGLNNIRNRTSMLGGKFSITSNEGGTCLNFDIPINNQL